MIVVQQKKFEVMGSKDSLLWESFLVPFPFSEAMLHSALCSDRL